MKKVLMVVGMGILIPGILKAIPSYARKHNLACTTCHYAPGYLSDFGQSYKLNGYRTEAEIGGINNETQDKISDLLILGNTFPIGARVKSYVYKKVQGDDRGEFEIPHEAALWFSGWLYKNISIWTEFEYEEGEFGVEVFTFGWHFIPKFNLVIGKARIFSFDPVNTFSDWGVRLTGQHKRPVNIRAGINTWRLRDSEPLIGFYGFIPGNFKAFYSAGITHIGGGEDFEDFYFRAGLFPVSNIWVGGFGVMGKTEYADTFAGITNDFTRFGGDIQAMFGNIYLGGTFVMGSDNSALGENIGVDHTAFDLEFGYKYELGSGYILPLLRYDSYAFSDNSESAENDIVVGMFYFPVENVKLGLEYDYVLNAKDAQGNDIDNASDNSTLRIILDLFF